MNCANCGLEIVSPNSNRFYIHVATQKPDCRDEDLTAHRGTSRNPKLKAEPS